MLLLDKYNEIIRTQCTIHTSRWMYLVGSFNDYYTQTVECIKYIHLLYFISVKGSKLTFNFPYFWFNRDLLSLFVAHFMCRIKVALETRNGIWISGHPQYRSTPNFRWINLSTKRKGCAAYTDTWQCNSVSDGEELQRIIQMDIMS